MEWGDTIRLKFANEDEWNSIKPEGWFDGFSNHEVCVAVIGETCIPAVMSTDGMSVVTPPKKLAGFLVNIRLKGVELPSELTDYVVPEPKMPKSDFFKEE